MTNENPYAAPKAAVSDVDASGFDEVTLQKIASGQRLMIWSIVASFASVPLRGALGPIAVIAGLVSLVLAIIGAVRVAAGLDHPIFARVLWGIAMIIPLVNLICMLVLSSRATKALRAGGYTVGFFGARPN